MVKCWLLTRYFSYLTVCQRIFDEDPEHFVMRARLWLGPRTRPKLVWRVELVVSSFGPLVFPRWCFFACKSPEVLGEQPVFAECCRCGVDDPSGDACVVEVVLRIAICCCWDIHTSSSGNIWEGFWATLLISIPKTLSVSSC